MKPKTATSTPPAETTAPTPAALRDLDENLLSAHDAALLANGHAQLPDATMRKIVAVVRTDGRFAGHYEALRSLATDAGFEPVRDKDLETALDCHQDFERLLTSEGWEHPAEILDPEGELGICYQELIHIAAARARREPDSERVKAVRDRLERAWEAHRKRHEPVERFVARLLEHDETTAKRLLQRASSEHEWQRRQLHS